MSTQELEKYETKWPQSTNTVLYEIGPLNLYLIVLDVHFHSHGQGPRQTNDGAIHSLWQLVFFLSSYLLTGESTSCFSVFTKGCMLLHTLRILYASLQLHMFRTSMPIKSFGVH